MSFVEEQRGRVEMPAVVDGELAQRFLALYREAFADLEVRSPARQSFTDEELLHHLADESVVKFVAWDRQHRPSGLAFMATDLSTVPWISLPYFEARFPEQYAREAVYYFGGLLVARGHRRGPSAYVLLAALVRRVAIDRAVAAFDCCQHTVDVARLPELIARVARRISVVDTLELEPQRYYAYVTHGLR